MQLVDQQVFSVSVVAVGRGPSRRVGLQQLAIKRRRISRAGRVKDGAHEVVHEWAVLAGLVGASDEDVAELLGLAMGRIIDSVAYGRLTHPYISEGRRVLRPSSGSACRSFGI